MAWGTSIRRVRPNPADSRGNSTILCAFVSGANLCFLGLSLCDALLFALCRRRGLLSSAPLALSSVGCRLRTLSFSVISTDARRTSVATT